MPKFKIIKHTGRVYGIEFWIENQGFQLAYTGSKQQILWYMDMLKKAFSNLNPFSDKEFIITDSCMWEANKLQGTRAPHAIEVVDDKTGQTQYIKSGSRIKFISGDITEPLTQEQYNNQQ